MIHITPGSYGPILLSFWGSYAINLMGIFVDDI